MTYQRAKEANIDHFVHLTPYPKDVQIMHSHAVLLSEESSANIYQLIDFDITV